MTNNGLSDHIGVAQILPYLEGLTGRGHSIECISVEFPERDEIYQRDVKPRLDAAGIGHYPIIRAEGRTQRKLERLAMPWRIYLRLKTRISVFQPDLLHCRSYLPLGAVLRAEQTDGLPFIFDMRGFWIDQRIESGLWNPRNPFFKAAIARLRKQEHTAYRQAAAIVVLSEEAEQAVKTSSDFGGGRVSVIPCSVDITHFTPMPDKRDAMRQALGLDRSELVLAHLGSTGPVYRIDAAYRLLDRLKHLGYSCKLLLLGDHDISAHVRHACSIGCSVTDGDFRTRRVPHSEVPMHLSAADFGLTFCIQEFSSLGVSATKTGEYLACGLPVISNNGIGDIDKIIEGGLNGLVLKDFSDRQILAAATQIGNGNFDSAEEIRDRAAPLFNIDRAIDLYDDLYCHVLNNSLPRQ